MTETTQVAEARRAARGLAEEQGWNETAAGKIAIAVTEAATNLVKHAGGGEIHIQEYHQNGKVGLELLVLDRGPGVANADDCLRDGYSTSGTAGSGLGAIRRLSNDFDIYSQLGKGTALVARFYADAGQPLSEPARLKIGVVEVPIRGESVSGDSWAVRAEGSRTVVLVADGLGHGQGAAEASRGAVGVLERTADLAPLAIIDAVHRAIRSTRGAAVAVASIDADSRQLSFAGVGNISAGILNGDASQHLISYAGTAGQAIRKVQDFTYPWPPGGLLYMHSDGLTTSWRLDAYPGLAAKHPSLIAGVLYRDANRGRDDACIVVVRGAEG